MKKENITVLRKILYAVESGGQVYGKQNYGAFAGVGANTPNEKAITIGAGQWYAEEARTLLLNIHKKYPKEFKKTLLYLRSCCYPTFIYYRFYVF